MAVYISTKSVKRVWSTLSYGLVSKQRLDYWYYYVYISSYTLKILKNNSYPPPLNPGTQLCINIFRDKSLSCTLYKLLLQMYFCYHCTYQKIESRLNTLDLGSAHTDFSDVSFTSYDRMGSPLSFFYYEINENNSNKLSAFSHQHVRVGHVMIGWGWSRVQEMNCNWGVINWNG